MILLTFSVTRIYFIKDFTRQFVCQHFKGKILHRLHVPFRFLPQKRILDYVATYYCRKIYQNIFVVKFCILLRLKFFIFRYYYAVRRFGFTNCAACKLNTCFCRTRVILFVYNILDFDCSMFLSLFVLICVLFVKIFVLILKILPDVI